MTPTNILVIDDSATMREILIRELHAQGHKCKSAASIEEALDLESLDDIELVITDIFMPGLGGIDGITRFRKNWPSIKILAISGGWDSMDGADALTAARKIGADAALKKPFEMSVLADTIDQIMVGKPKLPAASPDR
jgi:DNA-binding response OmpR family regulator